jgi:hypothetical protein
MKNPSRDQGVIGVAGEEKCEMVGRGMVTSLFMRARGG